jgi:branched-chain amino acid transport system substrate-binding protein
MTRRLPKALRSSLILGAAVVGAGFLFGSPTQAAEPIKIGVTIAMSPPGSVVQGTQVRDGLEVAKKMINDAGGLNGRPIELIYEDTQGIPEKARAAVEKLITRDKVVAITGEHQSSDVLAAMEVAHRYHIPYVNTNGWADAIREKGYPEVFNPGPYNSLVAISTAGALKGLKVKSVVSFAENTDYGIGLAKGIGEELKKIAPDVQYKYLTLDRTAKDFLPAILPMRANPPGAVIDVMLPPAAYIMMNQVYEQGIAPSANTFFYDASDVVDYPDFWQNVKEAGKGMLVFGLYHPKMQAPELAKKVADAYVQKTKNEPNRLIFQAADCLYVIADAIKRAKTTEPDALIKAMETTKLTATRGEITFSNEKSGYKYHQWLDIPHVTFQVTKTGQKIGDTTIVEPVGKPLDSSKVWRPQS